MVGDDSQNSKSCQCCKCCEEPAGAQPIHNAPGLAALNYRSDTYAGFQARLLQNLPLVRHSESELGNAQPLKQLLSRDTSDPTVALIDAFSCVADVLTFYQERIANEGYLRTATERRSVLELARAIGYELKPGVAASTWLAFTVEDAPGSPRRCVLEAGTPVQSVPPQGKLPQVFETSSRIEARAEWNALRPRQARRADLALHVNQDNQARALVLLGAHGSFPGHTVELQTGGRQFYRLDPPLKTDDEVDAVEVWRLYFTESAAGIGAGELLLFTARKSNGQFATLVRRVVAVDADPNLKRVRIDLEPFPKSAAESVSAAGSWEDSYPIPQAPTLAQLTPSNMPSSEEELLALVVSRAWRESDLQTLIRTLRWAEEGLVDAVRTQLNAPSIEPVTGAFAFRTRLGFFGHNAPKWASLPKPEHTNSAAYLQPWDADDCMIPLDSKGECGNRLNYSRTVWTDSQNRSIRTETDPSSPHVYLERLVPEIIPISWVVFDSPEIKPRAYSVSDARESSRADYGLSGRAMALTLADDRGDAQGPISEPQFRFRTTTAHVGSRRLQLADIPITAPIAAGITLLELEELVLGLTPGQQLAFTGERDDLPGVQGSEIALLEDIFHVRGRTMLKLQSPGLMHSYSREKLRINANVVKATHGESVSEVLGNGDAGQPNQRFLLKKPPTTFLSSSAPKGVRSTLEVRVGGVCWEEVPSLYGAAPDDQVYISRLDDDGHLQVVFGDGVKGARLPSGTLNVAAKYRSGIGPDGEVEAGSLTTLRAMPLGLRGVTNPVSASGADAPERLADARGNAPLTLLTFERVVSLQDYEDYARGFPGIGKARGDLLWIDGMEQVQLTVAGATGGAPGEKVLGSLIKAIAEASDPSQRFRVSVYAPRYFECGVSVAVEPHYTSADVLAAVEVRLREAFSFEACSLAQSVTAAEILSLIHGVQGVRAADLIRLRLCSARDESLDPSAAALPAFAARWDPPRRQLLPAELLLLNPAALTVEEMQP